MSALAEHLAQALCSLPKPDKAKVIGELLEDADFREAAAKFLIEKLIEPRENQQVRYPHTSADKVTSKGIGKKERGRKLRESYISELQQSGIQIYQTDSVWAKTANDLWVAIPTATMEWRPGRWFLGLPEDKVRERIHKGGVVVILLCQSAIGSRLDFVIPSGKVEEIVPKLSKSKGELKFNIKKVGNRYQLVIPRDNPVDVSDYKGDVSTL